MVLELFWNAEKTATGDSLTLFDSRSSSQKLDLMSSSCSANDSERRMTGLEQKGRKEWDDGRNEELWGVHMHSSLLQLRGVITKMYSHRHTQRKTDIQDNDAWNTHIHTLSPGGLSHWTPRILLGSNEEGGGGVKEMIQMVFSIVWNIFPYVCCAWFWRPRVSVITLCMWMSVCILFTVDWVSMVACIENDDCCSCLHINFFWCLHYRCSRLLMDGLNKKWTSNVHVILILHT